MLFNSYLFIFLFLPLTLVGYHLIGKTKRPNIATVWLVAASLLFYGWYNPVYVALITCSILFNYLVGTALASRKTFNQRKSVMALGVTINILLLGYFKYANFFIDNANAIFRSDLHLNTIVLPLAVSFFTLQQIAYLMDIYRGEAGKHSFLDYCLFVTFFPKLLSGPIVRFKEMMPQVIKHRMPHVTSENIAVGLAVFILGLFKKVVLADLIGVRVASSFDAAAEGVSIGFFNSWIGALAYTFQLYFDFSGYSDMAIGLGLLFGIRLPLNFYSPYKATSIVDFWRRWHMTLSRFLLDYLYIPFGGNRKGFPRQMINLLVVMVIAGLWHGAGWTFVIWGTMHGLYLVVNHCWRRLREDTGQDLRKTPLWGTTVSTLITFIAVTVAWVFFRADSVGAATGILKGMVGINGFISGSAIGIDRITVNRILISLAICWFLPNAQEYMSNYKPALDGFPEKAKVPHRWLRWELSLRGAVIISSMAILAILSLTRPSGFIYIQF